MSTLCIQETKFSVFYDYLCSSIWGSMPHGYSFRPSIGATGGLLTMLDCTAVEVWLTFNFDHVLSIHGRFIRSVDDFYVVNIYAPWENGDKKVL